MGKTIEEHKRQLIDGLIIARQEVLSAIESLPPELYDRVFLGTWNVKDILAHLIGWDITNLQAIQQILAGQYPTFFLYYDTDWHSYNAQLLQFYKVEPFSDLLERLNNSHKELIGYLESLPANDIVNGKAHKERGRSTSIRNLLITEAKDERKHGDEIRMFNLQQSNPTTQ